ncbi:exocyst complex component 3-like protein [Labeo rohita]|uniref:Exocyst complex component 3-like protein n=1 Tax=Labeo rohita TaxID=84645 RepID=A0A498N7B4_LABRO|nr:exocyst complex component 3-like protein [Labeo rohita]
MIRNDVSRLTPVLKDAGLLVHLIDSYSRHLFTNLDLLLNRDLTVQEIFCLLLWGKDVFLSPDPQHFFRVDDPLLLTGWIERATEKLLPKLQNDISTTLQNILHYDEQQGRKEDSMDEETFIRVHLDVTQSGSDDQRNHLLQRMSEVLLCSDVDALKITCCDLYRDFPQDRILRKIKTAKNKDEQYPLVKDMQIHYTETSNGSQVQQIQDFLKSTQTMICNEVCRLTPALKDAGLQVHLMDSYSRHLFTNLELLLNRDLSVNELFCLIMWEKDVFFSPDSELKWLNSPMLTGGFERAKQKLVQLLQNGISMTLQNILHYDEEDGHNEDLMDEETFIRVHIDVTQCLNYAILDAKKVDLKLEIPDFLKSAQSMIRNDVSRLTPVLKDAGLLVHLIDSYSRHIFTNLDLLLNRDLTVQEIFCLLLWGKDVFLSPDSQHFCRVDDPLLLTGWIERATGKLLPKLQNDISTNLQNILCYDEKHEHNEDSVDEETFIRVHLDVTQCLNAVIQSSKEFSHTLMCTAQTLCLKELHHFVQKYVHAAKERLEKQQHLKKNSGHLFRLISTCRQLRSFTSKKNSAINNSDDLSNIMHMLKELEDHALSIVQKMMKHLAQTFLRCYFKEEGKQIQMLTKAVQEQCASLPQTDVGKEIQEIFVNVAYDCVSHEYLDCLMKSKFRRLEKRWGNVGERMKVDAFSLHNTFTELSGSDDQRNHLLQRMSEVLLCSDVDALKITCCHLFRDFPQDRILRKIKTAKSKDEQYPLVKDMQIHYTETSNGGFERAKQKLVQLLQNEISMTLQNILHYDEEDGHNEDLMDEETFIRVHIDVTQCLNYAILDAKKVDLMLEANLERHFEKRNGHIDILMKEIQRQCACLPETASEIKVVVVKIAYDSVSKMYLECLMKTKFKKLEKCWGNAEKKIKEDVQYFYKTFSELNSIAAQQNQLLLKMIEVLHCSDVDALKITCCELFRDFPQESEQYVPGLLRWKGVLSERQVRDVLEVSREFGLHPSPDVLEEIDQFVERRFPTLPAEGPRGEQIQDFLKSAQSLIYDDVHRLIPVLKDAGLLVHLMGSYSRHLFTNLDLLLNRDLSVQEIFCLLLWGKDVFFSPDSQHFFRVDDPLLLTGWIERAKRKLLPKLQNDISTTLQSILHYDEQHGHDEDSMDEESFIRVHLDVTQCLNAFIQSSKEFSHTLMCTTQTLCLKELHHFVQEYVYAEKKRLEKQQHLKKNSVHLFRLISTCRQLRFYASQLDNPAINNSDDLSHTSLMLEELEDHALSIVQEMMKHLAQTFLRRYFKEEGVRIQILTEAIKKQCASLPQSDVGKEIQEIFVNVASDCISHMYLDCLMKSKLRQLEKRWGNVGERMRKDALNLHNTFTELSGSNDQRNHLLQRMSEVLLCSDVDALKITCCHLFRDFRHDRQCSEVFFCLFCSEQFVPGLLRWKRVLSKRQVREVLDIIVKIAYDSVSKVYLECLLKSKFIKLQKRWRNAVEKIKEDVQYFNDAFSELNGTAVQQKQLLKRMSEVLHCNDVEGLKIICSQLFRDFPKDSEQYVPDLLRWRRVLSERQVREVLDVSRDLSLNPKPRCFTCPPLMGLSCFGGK